MCVLRHGHSFIDRLDDSLLIDCALRNSEFAIVPLIFDWLAASRRRDGECPSGVALGASGARSTAPCCVLATATAASVQRAASPGRRLRLLDSDFASRPQISLSVIENPHTTDGAPGRHKVSLADHMARADELMPLDGVRKMD